MYSNQPAEYQARPIVSKSLFCETGTHNDMTQRPYESRMSQNTVDQFREITHNGANISPGIISGIANQFVRPTAQPTGNIHIDNGWDQTRLRFMFQVDFPDSRGQLTARKIIQGYSNYLGVTPNGAIDPNMVLYFNNVTTLRASRIVTPTGEQPTTNVASTNQLLRGNQDPNFFNPDAHNTFYMRPQDLFNTIQSSYTGLENVIDTRVMPMGESLTKSRRSNNNASHYLSGAMKAYRHSVGQSDTFSDLNDMANEAKGHVVEESMSGDKFFLLLKGHSERFNTEGCITYGELCQILEGFDHNTRVVLHNEVERQQNAHTVPFQSHQRGQTEHWNGSNLETVWASILTQSVPSIMMDLTLTRVAVWATNRTTTGEMDVRILDAQSFAEGTDLTPQLDSFLMRFRNELMSGLIMNNEIDFQMTLFINILNDSRITLSIQGQPEVEYASPSFCDGLFAPVITQTQMNLTNVATDLQFFTDEVTQQQYPQAPQVSTAFQGDLNNMETNNDIL